LSNFISRKREDYVDLLLITVRSTISGKLKIYSYFFTCHINAREFCFMRNFEACELGVAQSASDLFIYIIYTGCIRRNINIL